MHRDDFAKRGRLMGDSTDVAAGRSAWQRIRDNDRTSWSDWLSVARALAIGRAEAMAKAKANRPFGATYSSFFGSWLRENGLDGVNNQERYLALLILENLAEIEGWRAGLDEAKRRRLNHPGAVWHAWRRRETEAERSAPTIRNVVKRSMPSHKDGRPVHWPQDVVRRAAMALRECQSNDIFVLARAALESAIPTEDVLVEMIDQSPAASRQISRAISGSLRH